MWGLSAPRRYSWEAAHRGGWPRRGLLWAVPFSSVQFSSVQISSVQFSSVQFEFAVELAPFTRLPRVVVCARR